MPSLAPSWRYGMMEWFHRSMNHCLNSATDTGHDKKKQGPEGGKNVRLANIQLQVLLPTLFTDLEFNSPTYEKVWSAVLLQKSVEVVPKLRHPVQYMEKGLEVCRVMPLFLVGFHSFPVQVPQQKPVGRFHIVGERHHSVVTHKKCYMNSIRQINLS